MTVHIVELASVVPQPWRNGGGVTRELLAWPAGSGADWQLRVSVADIERDGPFSAYPGVQRCFAVLEGAGVELTFPSGAQRLTRASDPIAFDGALAPGCSLVDGPTRDLNLMVQRAAGRAHMRTLLPGEPLAAGPRWRGVYTVSKAVLDVGPGHPLPLAPHSLAWSEGALGGWCVQAADDAPLRAWLLALEARS